MQFWEGMTHVGALLCTRSTAVRATMAANWNPRRFVISAQICLDLLFRTKSVIPCNSCQVVKHKGGWFVDQRQNHLQIFLKIENISGLWFTNPSLWISNSKQRDETPIRSVDLDWCWWNWLMLMVWSLLRHQCFGVDGDTSALASHWCQIKGEQFPRQMSATRDTLVASCYDKHNIITTWKIINKRFLFKVCVTLWQILCRVTITWVEAGRGISSQNSI